MESETISTHPSSESASEEVVGVLTLALECDRPLAGSSRHCLAQINEVRIGRADERRVERSRDGILHLGVPDGRISVRHARLTAEFDRWIVVDTGSKNGVFLNGAPQQRALLSPGDVLQLGHTLFLFESEPAPIGFPLDLDSSALANELDGMATLLPSLARELKRLRGAATSTVSVLLLGPTGTGKELAARAVHAFSQRTGDFVAVNCGGLPPSLVEAELFGYRRGAFSGASQHHLGLVRAADAGTLFFDEVADLPPSSQSALLRVLQEREVHPLGATHPIPIDLRVVAATHKDLDELVRRHHFREDLLSRLSGIAFHLPPLTRRRPDLGLLVARLLARLTPRAANITLDPAAARAMLADPWPRNVRQLEQSIAGALAVGASDVLRPADFGLTPPPSALVPEAPRDDLRAELVARLETYHGNISEIARRMGKARVQIQRWLRRYGLDAAAYRKP